MLSIVLGIAGAVYFRIDALSVFGIEDAGFVGQVVTGLLASGGSNYIHNKLRHVSEINIIEDIVIDDEEEDDDI